MKAKYDIKKYDSIITKAFLAILTIIILLSFYSCTVQKQPKILITHVLAVTEQGDTLRLPINMIKPNVYYKVIHYGNDYWRPYNNHWNYNYNWQNSKPIYAPSNNSNNSNNNNNQTPVVKPSSNISPPPTPVRPNKRGGN